MKMSISEERCAVAEAIRHYAKESDESAYEFIHGYWPNDLADLIDPTCHLLPSDDGGFGCDRCYTWFPSMDTKPNYCPHCGARVTERVMDLRRKTKP